MRKILTTVRVSPIVLGFLTFLAAQDPPQEPPQPTGLAVTKELQKETLKNPPTYREKLAQEGKTVLDMTMKETIRRALINNLDIAIQNYSEEFTAENILLTKGFYDPVLNFSLGWQDFTSPTASDLVAGESDEFSWFTQFAQQLPSGGDYSVILTNTRNSNNNFFSTLNPSFFTRLRLDFRQPLWRGFRETEPERQLQLSNLSKEIDHLDFGQRVADVIRGVQNQYWELVFAIENFETQRKSMELAIIQHANNQKRVRIGVSAPIEITSSRAEVAGREQNMISSEINIIAAENALKRMLSSDPNGSIWSLSLMPTDRPTTPDVGFDMETAVQTGLARRPELEKIRVEQKQNGVDEAFYRKETKPTVNLRAFFSTAAVSGDSLQDSDGDGIPDQTIPLGNLWDSFQDIFGFDFNSWGVFADIQIPLRNRTNKANLARVGIEERRNLSRMRDEQQAVIVDVRNAYDGLKTKKKALEAASLARRLAEEQLRGENKRFQAGLSTNFQVLRFQRDLTSAAGSELRARIDYEQALTLLRTAMYTIIEDNDLTLAAENRR